MSSAAEQARSVRTFFDGSVSEWDTARYRDETYVGRGWLALRWLRRMAPGRQVLDLGCGTGHQALAALRQGHRVVAADFSLEMARATRDRILRELPGSPPAVIVADAAHPPFAPGSFDVVIALGLVGFVPDRPAMLRESAAVLRPGGALICDVANPEHRVLFHALSLACERLARWLGRPAPPHDPPGWYGRNFTKHTPGQIAALLRGSGLQPTHTAGSGFGQLRLFGRPVLPWRVENALARLLTRLTPLPGGRLLARVSLIHLVRAVRPPAPDAPTDAPPLRR